MLAPILSFSLLPMLTLLRLPNANRKRLQFAMRLLIIDDNLAMRRLIARVISDLADHIHECSDGSEALSAYRRYRPDWVLMDIQMRETNGLEATRKIISAFPEAQVVIVTEYDDDAMREAAREAGAVGFVAKENLLDLRRLLA